MLHVTTILCLLSLMVLAGAHYFALTFFLYWKVWWFDIVMHFFGGITVAFGVFTLKDLLRLPDRYVSAWWVMTGVITVVLGWEIFEYYFGLTVSNNYVSDTAIDIMMGLSGGFVGYLLGRKLREL